MTLLSVIRDVCADVGVTLPQSVFSNITGNRTMIEMVSKANEAAQSIAYDHRDWTKLRNTQIYAGDGTTDAFDLPADYQRMLLTANVWRSTSTQSPMRFIPDTDDWLRRRAEGWSSSPWGEWTMMGGQMHIWPILSSGTTAWFAYMHRNCIQLASAGSGDVFQSDADRFALDERVLKLAIIWKWKQSKGAAYAEDMGTYQDAFNSVAGRDSPAPIIVGRQTMSTAAGISYPWPTPVEPVTPL